MFGLKKIPKSILILDNIGIVSEDLKEKIRHLLPNTVVDYEEQDRNYDLVFLLDYIFRFNLKYYKPISNAEIIFKRESLDMKIVTEGLAHFSNCEIRNGV
ncbi:uncharacterized protein VNE69_09077 [Vairimorpha necatrix]|uniref:Uncharacterized protein n=1 Tax=Vairimorpha necatrix TaxID=6039 RepID=A0AAX4JEW4_9MICR